jgi:putative heme transporter
MPDAPLSNVSRFRLVRFGFYAWSIIGVILFLRVAWIIIDAVSVVLIPLAVALFPAALLSPLAVRLRGRGWNAGLVAGLLVLGFLVFLTLTLSALAWLVAGEFEDLRDTVEDAYVDLSSWLATNFDVTTPSFTQLMDRLGDLATNIDFGATTFAVVEVVGGVLLAVVALFFYLRDGDRLGRFALQLTPQQYRDDATEVAKRVWGSLGGYFRGQIIVATVDAVFIGIGLAILGVPLPIPLALLVFFGGLFPIVGAFVAGAVAVLVALADGGIGLALAVLVLNVAVQQLEGNLLEPVIVGRATHLHPLAILAGLTTGAVLYGLAGAFFAVPLLASIVRIVSYFLEKLPELDVDPHAGEDRDEIEPRLELEYSERVT